MTQDCHLWNVWVYIGPQSQLSLASGPQRILWTKHKTEHPEREEPPGAGTKIRVEAGSNKNTKSFPFHSPVTFARYYILETGCKSCSRKQDGWEPTTSLGKGWGKGLCTSYATITQKTCSSFFLHSLTGLDMIKQALTAGGLRRAAADTEAERWGELLVDTETKLS